VGQPAGLPAAAGYAVAFLAIPSWLCLTLYDPHGDRLGRWMSHSLDGGGLWQPAVPATGTLTSHLEASPLGIQHTFVWDTVASGIFGLSDNVVLRFVARPQPAFGAAAGTYRYSNRSQGPFQQAPFSATTFPFRITRTRVRVFNASAPNGIEPAQGALVYRIPRDKARGGALVNGAGEPFYTDEQGYLQGQGLMLPGDRLVALLPVELETAGLPPELIQATGSYSLYYTSAEPVLSGLQAHTVISTGVQVLTVTAQNPLVLFNLEVSLEWDARQEPTFVEQLKYDLERTAEFLYDWSDGQMSLGKVTIYHARQHWDSADIQIYATNRMRPNAAQGGVVSGKQQEVIQGSMPITITYVPGQVHMGAGTAMAIQGRGER
jgi:hypothetical protein